MARIVLSSDTLIGRKVLLQASQIVALSDQSRRLLAQIDAITNNGADTAALETSPECKFPVGSGVSLYADLKKVAVNLNQLSNFVASIDQG